MLHSSMLVPCTLRSVSTSACHHTDQLFAGDMKVFEAEILDGSATFVLLSEHTMESAT